MTRRTSVTTTALPVILNGILTAALDVVFVATLATLLWMNGRTSVIDPTLPALVVMVLVGSAIIAFHRHASLRRRHGAAHPAAVLAERISVPTQLAILAAGVAAWKITGIYQLGWGVCFASIAMLVAHTLLLLIDVTTRTLSLGSSRHTMLAGRRFASVQLLHIAAGLIGLVGIALAAPIHEWRFEIINGSVLIVAACLGLGSLAATGIAAVLQRLGAANPARPATSGR